MARWFCSNRRERSERPFINKERSPRRRRGLFPYKIQSFIIPAFMDILPQILVNGLIAGAIYGLIALGLSLIYGVLKFMNFAHGEMAMLGAYFYYLFFIVLEWAIIPSLAMTILLSAITGWLFYMLVFRPLRLESPWTLLIASIGVSGLAKAIVLLVATGKGRSYSREGFEATVYHLFDGKIIITDYQIFILVATAVVLFALALFLKYSKTGKAIRAVSDNMQIASILGINIRRTIILIFIISTCLAAFAGVLVAYDQNFSPNTGLVLSIFAFAAVIVGGLGNIWGAFVGAMALGIIQNLVVGIEWFGVSVPTTYKPAIAFILLILMLLLRPQGLFGSREEATSRK